MRGTTNGNARGSNADSDVHTVVPLTQPVRIVADPTPAVVDLVSALRASVEAARARREARA